VSTISRKIANELKLSKHDTKLRIKTADNHVSQAIGIVKNVEIDINNHKCKMKELVIMDNEYDIILGVNYFEAMNAGIIFRNNKKYLKFYKEYDVHNSSESSLQILEDKDDEDDPDDFELNLLNNNNPDSIIDSEHLDEDDFDQDYWDFPEEDQFFKEKAVKPDVVLEPHQLDIFYKIIAESAKKLIPKSESDLGVCSVGDPHKILVDPELTPIYLKPYKYSIKEQEQIKKELDLLLEAGIIEPSKSNFAFPLVKVAKPNGSIRICIDLRKLNKHIAKEPFPLPNIEELLERASTGKWFTKIDLKQAFLQKKVHKNSRKYLAFIANGKLYQWTRLVFGLKNSPFEFQRLINQLFGHLKSTVTFLDDLTVVSPDFDSHIKDVKEVLDILKEANLKINYKKCVWFTKKLNLLGNVIENNKISMDPIKTKAIVDRKPPKNFKDTQVYIGMINYWRRYIPGFAQIIAPIAKLLKKDQKWIWTPECQQAFDQMKDIMCNPPILRPANFSRPFKIYCDASLFSIASVLMTEELAMA
jgi:hypothetical protein